MTGKAKELPFNQTLFNIDKTLTAVARDTKEHSKLIALLTKSVLAQGDYITEQKIISSIKKDRFNTGLKLVTGMSLIFSMFYGAYSINTTPTNSKLDQVYIQKEERKERRPLTKQ